MQENYYLSLSAISHCYTPTYYKDELYEILTGALFTASTFNFNAFIGNISLDIILKRFFSTKNKIINCNIHSHLGWERNDSFINKDNGNYICEIKNRHNTHGTQYESAILEKDKFLFLKNLAKEHSGKAILIWTYCDGIAYAINLSDYTEDSFKWYYTWVDKNQNDIDSETNKPVQIQKWVTYVDYKKCHKFSVPGYTSIITFFDKFKRKNFYRKGTVS